MKDINKPEHNYDAFQLTIKDYRNFYSLLFYLVILFIAVIIGAEDAWSRDGILRGRLQTIIGIAALLISTFLLIKNTIKYFKQGMQSFTFKANSLEYICYGESSCKNINEISKVSYLFVANQVIGKNVYQNKTAF